MALLYSIVCIRDDIRGVCIMITLFKTFAIDFDNTIAFTQYPKILHPLPYAFSALHLLKRQGNTIILWTCREGDALQEALNWLKEKGNFTPHFTNEHNPEFGESKKYNCISRKIGCDYFIDDRSIDWNGKMSWKGIIERHCKENR
jgi:hypothetical protein